MNNIPIADFIKPINANHSIKEAVISLFLASPILKPERFKDLIETSFKDKFQLFEPVIQFQLEFRNPMAVGANAPKPEVMNNIGFKFTSFENGAPVRVLQGQNDNLNIRTFISYHALKYTRWNLFITEYMEIIKAVLNFSKDVFLSAVSIHYVDQFFWIDKSNIDLNLLFNKEAHSIPKDFFNAKVNNYSIVTEKQINETRKYLDRLEIVIDNNIIKPSVTISHNVTEPLPDVINLKDLIDTVGFNNILEGAHLHNKKFLKDLLTEPVCKMINLE